MNIFKKKTTPKGKSFTTIVVMQDEQDFGTIALVTETTTNDPMLARVRVVNARIVDDTASLVNLTLLSSGAEPSGVDIDFPTLDMTNLNSEYLDVPTGQYELSEELDLLSPQTLSFLGGTVYTIILTGDASNEIVLVNDTLMSE